MDRTYESGRHSVAFRASGWVRFLPASFLAFWLCGWAAGEVFAGGALFYGLVQVFAPGTPLPFGFKGPEAGSAGGWFAIGFLAVWLTMWTIGGIGALIAMLELITLQERILFGSGGLRVERRIGGWLRAHEWPADAIEGVTLCRRGGALEVKAGGKSHRVLALGTPAERQALRDELRALFVRARVAEPAARELPGGWESYQDNEGHTVLTRNRRARTTQSRFLWVFAFGGVAGTLLFTRAATGSNAVPAEIVPFIAILFLVLGSLALWLGIGGSEVRVRSGTVEFRRWFGAKVWSETLSPTRVTLSRSADSDNDEHFTIEAHEGPRACRVHQTINDLESARRLGRWLAAQTGKELEIPAGLDDD